LKSDRRKRSNLQQPLSRLLKLKVINPILKALRKFFIIVLAGETRLHIILNLMTMQQTLRMINMPKCS